MGEEHGKRIPTELEIEILQHIADEDEHDRSRSLALINCALVCKAWTRHVRTHLYYAVNMNFMRGSLQFERLREYTHLRPFVREFTWPRTRSFYCFNAGDSDIIKDIAPTVTKLRFRTVNHWNVEPPLKEAISAFTNIKELDMTGSDFEDWTTVVRIISGFPFLTTLAMPDTDTLQDGLDNLEISYPPPPSRLVHIKLTSGCEAETVGWIRKGSPIPNIQTVEAGSGVDSNVLVKLLRSLGGGLRHLIIRIDSHRAFSHYGLASSNLIFQSSAIVGRDISEASASRYRLTENTALESIEVISIWESTQRDIYRSAISNLIGSICSPHLQNVSVKLVCLSGEVEHFPWSVVNSLTKVSPHRLQKVEVALQLRVETNNYWGITSPLYLHSPREYESYFRHVRLALLDLDKKLIMSIVVRHPSQLFTKPTSLCSTRSSRIFLMHWYVTQMECDNNGTNDAVPVVLSSSFKRARLRR